MADDEKIEPNEPVQELKPGERREVGILPARRTAVSPAAPADGAYELWYPAGVRYGRAR